MRVLVLGGTRLTGPFTVRSLVEQGHQVTVFYRGQHLSELPDTVNRILGERRDLAEHARTFKQLAPDVVLDMLAFTRADTETIRAGVQGHSWPCGRPQQHRRLSSLWADPWHRTRTTRADPAG